jgi:glutathione S-transferase
MLTFFFAPGSSSMAVHIALHEVGVSFVSRPLSFAKREQWAREFLALNPEGKVPTLLIDGGPLTEVAAILFYLAKRYPEAGLLPPDIETEALAISWMSFIASTLHPARVQGLEHAKKVYGIADRRLGTAEWALDRYSIADIHLFRLFWRFANGVKPERNAFPNLWRHYDQMMLRPAVQRTIDIESAIGYELSDWFPAART